MGNSRIKWLIVKFLIYYTFTKKIIKNVQFRLQVKFTMGSNLLNNYLAYSRSRSK